MRIADYSFVKRLNLLTLGLQPGVKYILCEEAYDRYIEFRRKAQTSRWGSVSFSAEASLTLDVLNDNVYLNNRDVQKIDLDWKFSRLVWHPATTLQFKFLSYNHKYYNDVVVPSVEIFLDKSSWFPE